VSYRVEVWDAPRWPEGRYEWVEVFTSRSLWRCLLRATRKVASGQRWRITGRSRLVEVEMEGVHR
jgi:hypothetical protein